MTDIAIKVEGLGKKYKIGSRKSGEFRESFGQFVDKLRIWRGGESKGLSNPIAIGSPTPQITKSPNRQITSDFWALKDISFEIKQGEAVGIIGRNGAGKSTLLKILSRITKPTTGRFEINGRVSSLLEVGTGFHKELTGRENIYLNGTILGMKRREIKQKFDEIVDFSGVEQFIDTPVKHYSSGMLVRLAFSVAAHLEPEILIIDEVLAVGDAEFQKKCLGKMEDVTGQGRTVLFVSHNMGAVLNLCKTGIWLHMGELNYHDLINNVVSTYMKDNDGQNNVLVKDRVDRAGSQNVIIEDLYFLDQNTQQRADQFVSGSSISIVIKYKAVNYPHSKIKDLVVGMPIYNANGLFISVVNNKIWRQAFKSLPLEGFIICHIKKLPFMYGEYHFDINVQIDGSLADSIKWAAKINIAEGDYFSSGFPNAMNRSGVYIDHCWETTIDTNSI